MEDRKKTNLLQACFEIHVIAAFFDGRRQAGGEEISNSIREIAENIYCSKSGELMFHYLFFLAAIIAPSQNSQEKYPIAISFDQAQSLGDRIWKNESGAKMEGLTSWNEGEDFASLGIGHFIWYPPKKPKVYQETFPDLLAFLGSCGVTIPTWLAGLEGCPWRNRQHFLNCFQGAKMVQLRTFLFETKALQAVYIAKRLEVALSKITQSLELTEKRRIEKRFNAMVKAPNGLYALIDYLNFKGEGLSPSEKYRKKGWGLLQVLQGMPDNSLLPMEDFVKSAKRVLADRIRHAPHDKNEKRWEKGWNARLDTYLH